VVDSSSICLRTSAVPCPVPVDAKHSSPGDDELRCHSAEPCPCVLVVGVQAWDGQ
jgi:hypothetical protein